LHDTNMEDPEQHNSPATLRTPLLSSDRINITSLSSGEDYIGRHILTVHGEDSWVWISRRRLQRFLSSKWGHYSVIILVSLDVAGIFADFLITLHICEHTGEKGFSRKTWEKADEVLDVASLVFSCLFMLELLLSIWAFGFSYFKSKFHIFDATIIVVGFIVDVLLHGTIEEAGSLVVIGRLWRVFKIIEEFSAGADDQLEELQERVEEIEKENKATRQENEAIRRENEGLRYRMNQMNQHGDRTASS